MCDEVIAGPKTEAEIEVYFAALKQAQGEAGWEWYKNPTPETTAAVAAVEAKYEQVLCTYDGDDLVRRGDLFLCREHATGYAWNVGRVAGEVLCHCGFYKPTGTECGLPCM